MSRGYSLGGIETFYAKSFRRFRRKEFNTQLVSAKRLRRKLNVDSTPCNSPAAAFSQAYSPDPNAQKLCQTCALRVPCHKWIRTRTGDELAAMHLHLHKIGALNDQEKLTPFGDLARFLPQSGGLLIADYLSRGKVQPENMSKLAELLAALSLAGFKEPNVHSSYKFPWQGVSSELERLYPIKLFPDLYDTSPRRRGQFKEFNPTAGYVIHEWVRGQSFERLAADLTSEYFGTGDTMNLIYRVATFLQSVAQIKMPVMSKLAADLRAHILRPPLEFVLNIG